VDGEPAKRDRQHGEGELQGMRGILLVDEQEQRNDGRADDKERDGKD
jgi:hypothetical protein